MKHSMVINTVLQWVGRGSCPSFKEEVFTPPACLAQTKGLHLAVAIIVTLERYVVGMPLLVFMVMLAPMFQTLTFIFPADLAGANCLGFLILRATLQLKRNGPIVLMWHEPHGDSHSESQALQQYFIMSCHGFWTARRTSLPITSSLFLF